MRLRYFYSKLRTGVCFASFSSRFTLAEQIRKTFLCRLVAMVGMSWEEVPSEKLVL